MAPDNVDELASELAPPLLKGLGQADEERGRALLRELVSDWLREANQDESTDEILALLRRELLEAAEGRTPEERLTLLRVETLERQIRVLNLATFELGKQLIDGQIDESEAATQGREHLATAERLSAEVSSIADADARRPLERAVRESLMEALYAVEGKAMSARLNRYQEDEGQTDSDAPPPPSVRPPKLK